MATVRQYFETDFQHAVKLECHFEVNNSRVEARLVCDFAGFTQFISLYLAGVGNTLTFYKALLEHIQYGKTTIFFDQNIALPDAWNFPAELQIHNHPDDFKINVRFHGDGRWISWKQLPASRRIFIYSETELPENEILQLELEALAFGHEVQFRSPRHVMLRTQFQRPVAFISHDSRDGDIARKVALGMQQRRCSVWYDEFTIRAGDNLRDTIEKGLKECHKCIIVLSANFFANRGWTKKSLSQFPLVKY
jgi:hypothetical protein